MLWFVLEAIVAVLVLGVAIALYRRDRRLGPRLSGWGAFVELVVVVGVGLTISQFFLRPLVWELAPSIAATGTTLGKQVVTPLDHVLFTYTFSMWFAYMLARPYLLGALDVGDPAEADAGAD